MTDETAVRPHRGEPLALDLLNTQWVAGGEPVDYFDALGNVQAWLDENGLTATASAGARAALVETRDAIRAVLTDGDAASRERLNTVLAHGAVRLELGDDRRPTRTVTIDDPVWEPAVWAAINFLELLDAAPGRIRRCDHPQCVLWFLDTSKNGTRRWHSMAICGNRAKAQRHYARVRMSD